MICRAVFVVFVLLILSARREIFRRQFKRVATRHKQGKLPSGGSSLKRLRRYASLKMKHYITNTT